MGYNKASTEDVDSVVPEEYGGMWFLRDELGAKRLGVTVLELEPGAKGKEHNHEGDGQEEVYLVVEGDVDVDLPDSDQTVTLGEDEAVRLDADETRQIFNRGDVRAKLALAGA
jgi:mannose-6-phosphate isomerase-like protein (cupin superfamily)